MEGTFYRIWNLHRCGLHRGLVHFQLCFFPRKMMSCVPQNKMFENMANTFFSVFLYRAFLSTTKLTHNTLFYIFSDSHKVAASTWASLCHLVGIYF